MDSPNLDISYQGNIRGPLSLVFSIYYVFMVVLFFFGPRRTVYGIRFPTRD